MVDEFFAKILSGGFRLPHELLRSEKFQKAFGTTRQGWRLAHVLKEHQFEIAHTSVLVWHAYLGCAIRHFPQSQS